MPPAAIRPQRGQQRPGAVRGRATGRDLAESPAHCSRAEGVAVTETTRTSAGQSPVVPELIARLERLPRRAVRYAVMGILGLGLFTVFYCNFDINVSFIQTCVAIKHGCSPANAAGAERLPVCLYLAGYIVGDLLLAPLSDRLGRRRMIVAVLAFAVVGSLITALSQDFPTFVTGRAVTGVAMGGLLAIGNTYIGELAPSSARARYTALTFVLCTLGALVGIWIGLLLTTPTASFPNGLPGALAGPSFTEGWRWVYAVATAVAAVAVVSALVLPESPRWLIDRGRVDDAEALVERLERRALRRGPLAEPTPSELPSSEPLTRPKPTAAAYLELLSDSRYVRRALVLALVWFFGYATVFAFSTSSTSILTGLHFTAPVAGMISAVGGVGFFVQGMFSARWSERLERRYWLPIGAVMTVVGGVLVAELGAHITWAFIGSFIIFFGFNVWVPPTFALSAESFPTRTRSAGFGLVDGLGSFGGMVGVLVVAPLVPKLTALEALTLIPAFLVIAAVIGQFTPTARNRTLETLSP